MISAKVVADSKNQFGNRITTMVVTMPRFILAEFNTHRMFSRNSASSRAIPLRKMLKMVEENPFIPMAWQKEHTGMQGTEYHTENIGHMVSAWLSARNSALAVAGSLGYLEVTKQIANRLLEPFMYHTVIVTATEWENFFALRCPRYLMEYKNTNGIVVESNCYRSKKDFVREENVRFPEEINWFKQNQGQAEIHMMALAESMWDAYNESTPKELMAGEWHIPFGDNINLPSPIPIDEGYTLDEGVAIRKVKIATARCARVSYTVVGEEGKPDNYDNDITLHDRLATAGHWSPFEHCAQAMSFDEVTKDTLNGNWSGNFRGFVQYRKTFQGENKV